MNWNIPPLDTTSTSDKLRILMAVALGIVATLHVQNPLGRDGQGKNHPKKNRPKPDSQGCPGNTFAHLQKKWREKHGSPRRGDFQSAAWLLTQGKLEARTNVTKKKDRKQG